MKRQVLSAFLLMVGSAAPLMAQQTAGSEQAPPTAAQETAEPGQVTPPAAQQAAVPATGQPAPQAETADAETGKKNEKVCKLTAVSGTRFKSRLCYTQEQWDTIDRAHKDKMREIDSQPVMQKTN